jgi:integrase
MQERRRELTEAAGAAYYDNDLVVSKPDGAPYRRDAMSTAFGQLIS